MRTIAILLLLLLPSCSMQFGIGDLYTNPFEKAINLEEVWTVSNEVANGVLQMEQTGYEAYESGCIRFPVISDVHLRRENGNDRITHYNDNFLSFLESEDFPFTVNLGDLVDEGSFGDDITEYIAGAANRTNGNFIYVLGNHELHAETRQSFNALLSVRHGDNASMARYAYGPLSIYKLDNASRTFGRNQLEALKKALDEDKNPYKILVAHEAVFSGGVLDQTIVLEGMPIREANRLAKVLSDSNVSLLLTAHHHKGNIIYKLDGFQEFNLAAGHRNDIIGNLESKGYWYVVEINPEENMIYIECYLAETGKLSERFEIPIRYER